MSNDTLEPVSTVAMKVVVSGKHGSQRVEILAIKKVARSTHKYVCDLTSVPIKKGDHYVEYRSNGLQKAHAVFAGITTGSASHFDLRRWLDSLGMTPQEADDCYKSALAYWNNSYHVHINKCSPRMEATSGN